VIIIAGLELDSAKKLISLIRYKKGNNTYKKIVIILLFLNLLLAARMMFQFQGLLAPVTNRFGFAMQVYLLP
jgi:hypothetical protein